MPALPHLLNDYSSKRKNGEKVHQLLHVLAVKRTLLDLSMEQCAIEERISLRTMMMTSGNLVRNLPLSTHLVVNNRKHSCEKKQIKN